MTKYRGPMQTDSSSPRLYDLLPVDTGGEDLVRAEAVTRVVCPLVPNLLPNLSQIPYSAPQIHIPNLDGDDAILATAGT